jgi:hypothetical protein
MFVVLSVWCLGFKIHGIGKRLKEIVKVELSTRETCMACSDADEVHRTMKRDQIKAHWVRATICVASAWKVITSMASEDES